MNVRDVGKRACRVTLERPRGEVVEFGLLLDDDEWLWMRKFSEFGRREDGSRVMAIRPLSITGGAA